jgi:hypothetical protein
VHLEQKVIQVTPQVIRVIKVHKALLVLKDQQDPVEDKVQQVHLVLEVEMELQVQEVLQVPQAQ